ncbi:MAG: hypothetical protein JJT75_01695, partial [Opitutales bacterium]|nr:hypothetical protein [Opitutales bacterium]
MSLSLKTPPGWLCYLSKNSGRRGFTPRTVALSEGVYLPNESAGNSRTSEDLPRRWMRLKFRQVISAADRAMNQPDYA